MFPENTEEVVALFELSRRTNTSLTFRAAGTSLSGQAVGEGILVCVTRGWRDCEVLEEGKAVRVGPGLIAARANQMLRRYDRKIGPDPASLDSCMMGGVLANNSSGMCCGTEENAYKTLKNLRFVLASGLDTRDPLAKAKLAGEAPELVSELMLIRDEIRASTALAERIRKKYRIKNTMGYSLNAFLDYDEPLLILAHLMIGSEGTLGFIAEAELETVALARFKATALLEFPSIENACAQVSRLTQSGAQALELMDERALCGKAPAALLVEYAFDTAEARAERIVSLQSELGVPLECDADEQEKLWKIRKGALPNIGATRAPGSTVIIEDVAVAVEHLADCTRELREILDRAGYREAAIFGHAKDGNLHFVISQAFETPAQVAQYERLMQEVTSLITQKYGGSLKAEHGTGRNMAPFVELEWGKDAYALMRRVKQAIDPQGFLNPGVLLNEDPRVHLKNLKSLPLIDPETDRCMECGFCEPRCPSRDLTLSPRQRIAVRREVARGGEHSSLIMKNFSYPGLATCAADGMCATVCPVEIDTGAMVKRLRAERRSAFARALARLTASSLFWFERIVPWTRLGKAPKPPGTDVIYFPSCVNRWMTFGESSLGRLAERVLRRAGKTVWIPSGAQGQCCGLAFGSKGFTREAEQVAEKLIAKFWSWSEEGKIPILVDSSPCALQLKTLLAQKGMKVRALDSVELAAEILPLLSVQKKQSRAILHPVCSIEKMGLRPSLKAVAESCADEVVIPASANCCGFAGDRGFFVPELTRAATAEQAREITKQPPCGAYSTSTTCEIAMRRATGRRYDSLWKLLDLVSR